MIPHSSIALDLSHPDCNHKRGESRPRPVKSLPFHFVSKQLSPFPGTYWVIQDQLLAGGYPGDHSEAAMDAKLCALLDAGISSFVNLMEEEELEEHSDGEQFTPYEDRLERLAAERDKLIEIMRHPISSAGTPTEEEMALILDTIDAEIEGRNSPTYIHCSDGAGRTGLVIGCYLARHNIAVGKDAVAKIHELRTPHPELAELRSPANIVQERMVTRWKPGT
jgi:protein-tyrosine phosphatase